jgi:hypothetical protein
MLLDYSGLSRDGLVILPTCLDAPRPEPVAGPTSPCDFLDSDRDCPEIIGHVPNLSDFAVGDDSNVGAFEIKGEGTDVVCLPDNLAHLLPTTALIIDDLYAHAGAEVAANCQVSLQFFRKGYCQGEQLLFDRIHRHATEGKMVIYVVTAIDPGEGRDPLALGTEFYAPFVMGQRVNRPTCAVSEEDFRQKFLADGVVAAPGGAIIRFSETTLHAAPDITHGSMRSRRLFGVSGRSPLRRSLLNIIASYKQDDGTVYGRTRPPNDHRASPVEALAERVEVYRKAGAKVLAELWAK